MSDKMEIEEMKEIKEIIEMMRKLPNPNLNFWKNTLRVDIETIQGFINNEDKSEFVRQLESLLSPTYMVNIVSNMLKLDKKIETKGQIVEAITKDHFSDYRILIIFLCKSFLYKKKGLAKAKVKNKYLNEELAILGQYKGKDLLQCLLLFSIDENKLKYYLLFDKIEKAALTQYKLIVDTEENSTLEHYSDRLEKGMNFKEWIIKQDINVILEEYEKKEQTRKETIKLGLVEEENHFFLFLQRTKKRESVNAQNITVWETNTEIMILKFSNDGKILNEHYTEKGSTDIAAYLCSKAYDARLKFIIDSPGNGIKRFMKFMNNILESNDELLELKELDYYNFPVIGTPILKLSKSSNINLSESLADFKKKGFDLLDDLNNLPLIKLMFKNNSTDGPNIITLKTLVSNNEIKLSYLNNHLSSYKTDYFMIYMKDQHNLEVRPTSKDQDSQ